MGHPGAPGIEGHNKILAEKSSISSRNSADSDVNF